MYALWQKLKNHFVPSKENTYRPHLLRRGFLIFFLAVSLAAEGFLVADLVTRQSGVNFLAAIVQGEIIALTNAERSDNHVGTLAENVRLDAAAQAKAEDMATKGYFSHVGPDGKQPWTWVADAGYSYQWAGENLAVRFVDSKDVVSAWMASPSHRANMVKPVYTEIGVGVANGLYQGQPATFIVQYFGAPSAAAPVARSEAPSLPHTAVAFVGVGGQVQAAEASAAPARNSGTQSFVQSVQKQAARLTSEPRATTQWVLGGITVLMLVALALTFFVHLHVQPTEMLIGGTVVVFFVISLIAINVRFLSATVGVDNAAGAVFSQQGTMIGSDGASISR